MFICMYMYYVPLRHSTLSTNWHVDLLDNYDAFSEVAAVVVPMTAQLTAVGKDTHFVV